MSRGKHLSLEEARTKNQLDRFAKENPSEADKKRFDNLLDAMAHGEPPPKAKSLKAGGKT